MSKKQKKWHLVIWRLYVLAGAVYFSMLAGMLSYSGILDQVDNLVSDTIYQWISRNKRETMIKIVAIDAATVEKLGVYADWSRSETAKFIEVLNSVPKNAPNVIGFNLNYYGEKDTEGDRELEEVCSRYDNICLGASVTERDENPIAFHSDSLQEESPLESIDIRKTENMHIQMPYDALLPYVIIGVTNTAKYSEDGYIRNAVASISADGIEMDSFAVAVYKMYMDSIGKVYSLPKLDVENSFAFNYSKKSMDYTVYSFYDVVAGNIPASTFRNSIVLVGDYTDGENTFKVPNQKSILMSDIEVQANILEALMTQKTGQNVSRELLAGCYAVFVAVFFIVTFYSSGFRTILESALLIIMQTLGCCGLNRLGYYVPVLIPILFVLVIAAVNLFVCYIRARRDRAVLEGVFKKYVDEQVVNEIVKDGMIEAQIGVVRKDIAVLFVDIRGFTSLSESLEPEQVVDILNSYLTLVADAVAKNGGTLDKFIGDAAMAVFNSPVDMEDYVFRAVCTAWDILTNAAMLDEKYQKKYGKQVTFGIGVHCGEAVIGNIGCDSRMDYTAIGDTVNTASRLEGIAGPAQILISSEVGNRLEGRVRTVFAGEFALKGKKDMVSVYAVEGILREEKEAGRKLFFSRRKV